MKYIKQYNLFGEDVTDDIIKTLKHKKNIETQKKRAETRKRNKENMLKEYDRHLHIAYCNENGDLFGNIPTEEERKNSLNYLKIIDDNYVKKKNI